MITMKDIIREGNPLLHENAKDVFLPLSKDDEETSQPVNNKQGINKNKLFLCITSS